MSTGPSLHCGLQNSAMASEGNPKVRWIGKAGGPVPNLMHRWCAGEPPEGKGTFVPLP